VLLVITFYSYGSLHHANKTRQQVKTGKTPIAGGPAVARHTGAIVPAEASVVSRQRTWGTAGSMPEFAELPGWAVKSAKVTRDPSTCTNSFPPAPLWLLPAERPMGQVGSAPTGDRRLHGVLSLRHGRVSARADHQDPDDEQQQSRGLGHRGGNRVWHKHIGQIKRSARGRVAQ
jgi:hypothetical protein